MPRVFSNRHKRNLSIAAKKRVRKPHSEETISKIRHKRSLQSPPRPKGYKMSEEQKRKIGAANRGSNSSLWIDGRTKRNYSLRIQIMNTVDYKLWRKAVFERDNYTCQKCGQRGGRLNADHIKPFSKFPELHFAIDNGRTLCESCHRKTETYGGNSKCR